MSIVNTSTEVTVALAETKAMELSDQKKGVKPTILSPIV
jgi:hypothetical protein